MTRDPKTAEELAALIKAELGVEAAQVVVTADRTLGWRATVTGTAPRPFIVQLKADDIAARLRQRCKRCFEPTFP